ncbi:MAG: DUF2336 domain-containing protein, partial [Hyphomicrobiales bacterium]|nr:DUF2336 domain-containing protein [Hyphomicrobiales bacterium]
MIIRKFLSFAQTAGEERRAEAAGALARAYLYSELPDDERRAAARALVGLLDDPSTLVRRALAEAVASALDAPHALVLGLACDGSEVSAVVLARTPVLGAAELVDCARAGDAIAQSAVALRPRVPAHLAASLAAFCEREAAISLVVNDGAEIDEATALALLDRFGDDAELREAMLERPSLPVAARCRLIDAAASALGAFAAAGSMIPLGRARRAIAEERQRGYVRLAHDGPGEIDGLVRALRASNALTAALLLRAALSREIRFVAAALAALAGAPVVRAAAMLADPRSPGFAALLARADVPEALRGALAAGAQAVRETRGEPAGALDAEATSRAVELAEAASPPVGPRAIALLRRLELEALREAARAPDFEEPAPLELFAPASATSVAGDAFDALDFALVAEREAADEAPPSVAWTPVEVVAGEDEPAAV